MGQFKAVLQDQESNHVKDVTIQVSRSEIYQGHLVLINKDNPIKQPISFSNLMPIGSTTAIKELHQGILLEKTCLQQLVALLDDCKGMDDIVAVSGYRSKEEQEGIYAASLVENGGEYTAQYVALPDCSEHQTGLAIDVGKIDKHVDFIAPSFPDSGVYLAFKMLAAQYGFIQRYKAGKESLTAISCEPWHFRYVGVPHAKIMEQQNFCLEEYIDYVQRFTYEGEHLRFESENSIVHIYYVDANEGAVTTVPIMSGEHYSISGNNRDGYIVTVITTSKGQEVYGL